MKDLQEKIYLKKLFVKFICKTTNLEFLKLKEKPGLCLYKVICDEQEFISTSEEIFKEEKFLHSMMLKIIN